MNAFCCKAYATRYSLNTEISHNTGIVRWMNCFCPTVLKKGEFSLSNGLRYKWTTFFCIWWLCEIMLPILRRLSCFNLYSICFILFYFSHTHTFFFVSHSFSSAVLFSLWKFSAIVLSQIRVFAHVPIDIFEFVIFFFLLEISLLSRNIGNIVRRDKIFVRS